MSFKTKQKDQYQESQIDLSDNISATQQESVVTVTGKLGVIKKDFTKIPAEITIVDKKILIKTNGMRKKDLAIMNTAKSILNNMIVGVERGFTYKLKIIFAHFPITVRIKGKRVYVENFFGERSSRISDIIGEGTNVSVAGDDVIVEGTNLEEVSQTAANIESSTKLKGKDQRVFLDGIYIYSRLEGIKQS
jgi:large subunit ribosomal protein L6